MHDNQDETFNRLKRSSYETVYDDMQKFLQTSRDQKSIQSALANCRACLPRHGWTHEEYLAEGARRADVARGL